MLLLSIAGIFSTCTNNNGIAPKGITYSYNQNGAGTSTTEGALVINIHTTNTAWYNEYYIVKIPGVGTYTLQPGTIQLSSISLLPGNYPFSVVCVCRSNNNKTCKPRTSNSTASITAATTTVAEVWF